MVKYSTVLIDPKDLDMHWPNAAPKLEAVMAPNSKAAEMAELKRDIECGNRQLFGILDLELNEFFAWCVTKHFENSAGKRVVEVEGLYALGIGLDVCLGLWREFEEFSRYLGVDIIRIQGRPGWVRVMKPAGYSLEYSVISKELN